MEVSPRVFLRSSLDKIIFEENVEENIKDCVDILVQASNIADETLCHMRTREESSFLEQQLEYDDLKNVGNYQTTRKKIKNNVRILFMNPPRGVEFFFTRKKINQSVNEFLLGEKARDLSPYTLSHVDVVKKSPYVIFGFQLPFSKENRKTVYRKKN